jgi:arginine decarboxylase
LKALGRHLLTEFYGCDPHILSDTEQIKKRMEEAVSRSGATVIDPVFHWSNPQGVSGLVVIAELHLAFHTWPEHGYAAVDLFTSGEEIDPWRAYEFLKEKLKAQFTSIMELKRGELDILGKEARRNPLDLAEKEQPRAATVFKTPTQFFLVSGTSDGYTRLNAFDGALLSAGIGNTNLVRMSSIVPPHCEQIRPIPLPPGALVPVAYASITCDVPGEMISAGVAVALPEDQNQNGLIMEYSAKGPKEEIEEMVRQMAIEGMKLRGWEIRDLQSVTTEYRIKKVGAAFAAVVLWGD